MLASLMERLEWVPASSQSAAGLTVNAYTTVHAVQRHRLHSVMVSGACAVLVLQGEKVLSTGQASSVFPAGSMFMLPPRIPFSVENHPDSVSGRYMALCLAFGEEQLARAAGLPCAASDSAAVTVTDSLRVRVDTPLIGSIAHFLDMAHQCPAEQTVLSLCLETVLTLIAARSSCLPSIWDKAATWSARCAFMVGMDPARKWDVAGIARHLAVSDRTLRRRLEAEGTSLRTVLRDVRLNSALSLLQTNAGSVGEVAARCGYDSPSRFAVLFRERFGLAPAEVLRLNAANGAHLSVTGRQMAVS